MADAQTDRRVIPRPWIAIAVAAAVAVGVALRFVTKSDLWLDEALSVNIAKLPFGQIAPWLKHDGAPPLYYWLLHLWSSGFGTSDLAVRSLSGTFGVASLVVCWFCGRRIGDERTAWTAVVVLALNPFAIRFATETRMYSMVIFFVFLGILATRRAVERATVARLVLVAACSAALVYLHYWCIPLVGAAIVTLAVAWWRSDGASRPGLLRVAAALAVGAATLAAWLPTMRYQQAHTGTPWAEKIFPTSSFGQAILEYFGGPHSEGWVLVFPAVVLLALGAFGVHATVRHADGREATVLAFDAHETPTVRWEAAFGLLGLVFAATVAYVGGSTFQPRYAAITLPVAVLLVARGVAIVPGPRVRGAVLAGLALAGLASGLRNVTEQRTQTGQVAASLRAGARPGDVVVYCPDQLGPATNRLFHPSGIRQAKYPLGGLGDVRIGLVDWVDYTKRLAATTPQAAATRAVGAAGRHTVWVVTAPGYRTHDSLCGTFVAAIGVLRNHPATEVVHADPNLFERAGLMEITG